MSRVEAAAAIDRLPWLPDEPKPRAVRRNGSVAIWASIAVLLVAAAGFWVGMNSVQQPAAPSVRRTQSTTIVRLPEAKPAPEVSIAAQPEVRPVIAPQVRPEPTREVRISPPPVRRQTHEPKNPVTEEPAQAPPASVAPSPIARAAPQFAPSTPWQPRVIQGSAGRLVEIGAFGSVRQAKRGWWFMVRDYPAMAHLPAVVRPDRNSRGRTFYRFRVGTTSQAHSEVLCQRMQRIRLSCAVIGLPWKAKVER